MAEKLRLLAQSTHAALDVHGAWVLVGNVYLHVVKSCHGLDERSTCTTWLVRVIGVDCT